MQLMPLLHKMFEKQLPFIHKVRLKSLMDISNTAVSSNRLYLTGLGRDMQNKNKTRSNILQVDRLLRNKHLQKESDRIYQVMNKFLIKENDSPWIHIDWSCINAKTALYVLRASISAKGRSIVLYEECHPQNNANNHVVHMDFLWQLKRILPAAIKPVIVTDAGFRAIWFKHVLSLGWDFVGRLRNKNRIYLEGEGAWKLSSTYFAKATNKPMHCGQGLLTGKSKVPVNFVLYKSGGKNRHKVNINKKQCRSSGSQKYSKSQHEPWLLVTSLSNATFPANEVVKIYRQRMRIEENFRDTKCPYYGLGLKKSLTQTPERMKILLLIAAIASFAAWLAGIYTEKSGNAVDYQAHSSATKGALSKIFLGREVIKRGFKISWKKLQVTMAGLSIMISQTQAECLV